MIRTTTAALAVGAALTLAACSSHSSSATPSASGTSSAPVGTGAPSATAGAPSATAGAASATAAPSATAAAATTGAASAAPTTATTIPATVTSPGSTPTAATPTATTSAATPVAGTRCLNAQLKVSLGNSSPGAGQIYTSLVFTNTGTTSCTLVGHPGVSYVAGDDGHQVGTSAKRDTGTIRTVTLAPGGSASATLHEVNYLNFDQAVCKPVETRGLRVYPPGSTAAFFVPRAGKQCSATVLPDPALSIGVVKAGTGD
jgi:Protein of unknown function (DUF4232)